MATIRWGGATYAAKPLRRRDNGDWEMQALEHGPRFVPGTVIVVKASDVVDMKDAAPPGPIESLNKLIKALDAERKELPSIQSLLAQHRENKGETDGPQT